MNATKDKLTSRPYKAIYRRKINWRTMIKYICSVCIAVLFLSMLGVVGGMERDTITMTGGVIAWVIHMILMWVCTLGLK